MRLLRVERDKRLAKDDWKVVKAKETGTNLTSAFKTYRQALRDLPSTATPTLTSTYQLDMTSLLGQLNLLDMASELRVDRIIPVNGVPTGVNDWYCSSKTCRF